MNDFLAAAIPEPFTILGRRLRPLSLGHILHLQRFGCDPVLTLDQLIRAVIICSRPASEISAAFDDPALPLKLKLWGLRLAVRDFFTRPRLTALARVALFHQYYFEHRSNGPPMLDAGDATTPPGAPWLQHLRATLISKVGYSPSESLELPYSLALWDYYTFWENEGKADIMSPHRKQMRDLANSMDAKIREQVKSLKLPS